MANLFSGVWKAMTHPIDEAKFWGKVATGKTSLKNAPGEHQRMMNKITVPILGDNKVAKNSDAIVGTIFAGIFAAGAAGAGGAASAAGSGAGGAASGTAGAAGASGAAAGAGTSAGAAAGTSSAAISPIGTQGLSQAMTATSSSSGGWMASMGEYGGYMQIAGNALKEIGGDEKGVSAPMGSAPAAPRAGFSGATNINERNTAALANTARAPDYSKLGKSRSSIDELIDRLGG